MTDIKTSYIDEKSRVLFQDSIDFWGTTIWIATLSDGREVYQDDYPDPILGSAWVRLGNFIRDSGLSIVGLRLRFRSHTEVIEGGADGYYFAKGATGIWGYDETIHSYVVGTLKNGNIIVERWRIPELISEGPQARNVEEAGPKLIVNPHVQTTNREETVSV